MLTRLYISNYALIDELEIRFDDGLTIITGETGAGKSIILGALSLILGERAESRSVRNPENKVVVEASFDIAAYDLESYFTVNEIDFWEHECIVRREISATGRSRAFVNDSPVNISLLKELTSRLVDIHSQHSNMLLSKPAFQLSVLDSIAANKDAASQYNVEYICYKNLQKQLAEQQENLEKTKAEEDYIRFQLTQFEDLKLAEDEDVELENLQKKLSNVSEIKQNLWMISSVLNGEDNSVLGQLSTIAQRIQATERNLSEIEGMSERAQAVMVELKDIAQSIAYVDDSLVDDPRQLEYVESRLNAIYELERKHSVSTVNELLEVQRTYEQKLSLINCSEDQIAELQKLLEAQKAKVKALAATLTKTRKAAAQKFVTELKPLAQALGMKNLAFDIQFSATDFTPSGADAVEFLFAFNKNQALLPVKDTASGGEISRLMLSIKSIIARSMNLPTIIFDEVDTGVSGDVANKIGEMMGDIATRIQVLAITHLPQVAAHGSHHLMVYKADDANTTLTHVKALNEQEHVLEIARMLSGKDVNQAAIDNAKSLIESKK
ncbi:MAG: DNA repair protein RecN [Bacteroidales bacterium]|nr:DNA repair protein RecN [Bacteroidales bacterium]